MVGVSHVWLVRCSEDRVRSCARKLAKAAGTSAQGRIDSFFTLKPALRTPPTASTTTSPASSNKLSGAKGAKAAAAKAAAKSGKDSSSSTIKSRKGASPAAGSGSVGNGANTTATAKPETSIDAGNKKEVEAEAEATRGTEAAAQEQVEGELEAVANGTPSRVRVPDSAAAANPMASGSDSVSSNADSPTDGVVQREREPSGQSFEADAKRDSTSAGLELAPNTRAASATGATKTSDEGSKKREGAVSAKGAQEASKAERTTPKKPSQTKPKSSATKRKASSPAIKKSPLSKNVLYKCILTL